MAVLADEANVSKEGKLNVLGIFDQINAGNFPCVHPRMVYAFRLRAEYADSDRRVSLRIRLLDEDGGVILNAEAHAEVPRIPPGEHATVNQIIALNQVRFPRPGAYKFEVLVRDADEPGGEAMVRHETPFKVVKVDGPPAVTPSPEA